MINSLFAAERLFWENGVETLRRDVLEDAMFVFDAHEAMSRDDAIALIERANVDGQNWHDVEFEDLQCVKLDGNAAILSYSVRGRTARRSSAVSAKCTSLYMRRDGRLRLAFHEHLKIRN